MCKCKGCVERSIGCHSRCDTYKVFRAQKDNLNAIIRADKMKMGRIFDRHSSYCPVPQRG